MPSIRFESESCSRCGGSGHYSYCQRFGTVCFKCSGTKLQTTRRGKAARGRYEAWAQQTLVIPIESVTPGMRISIDGSGRRGLVTKVEWDANSGSVIDGRCVGSWAISLRGRGLSIFGGEGLTYCAGPGSTVRRAPTPEEIRAIAPTLGKGATLVEDAIPAPATQEACN